MADIFKKIADAFIGFKAVDAVDIVVMAVMLFFIFRAIKKRNARTILIYLVLALVFYFAALVFRDYVPLLYAVLSILIVPMLAVLAAVIFAPEVKRVLVKLSGSRKSTEYFSAKHEVNEEVLRSTITEIIRSVQNMSKKNIGALIVISPGHIDPQILDSGTALNAVVSAPLLESIFNTKAPMHDGAVVIRSNLILAAGCFLTLSQNANLPQDLGTRHRAALGVSEFNNVLSIVVSEQTGIISVCRNGELSRYYDSNMLGDELEQIYGLSATVSRRRRRKDNGQ